MRIFVPYLASSTNVAIRQHYQQRRKEVKNAAWAVKAACHGVAPVDGLVDLVFRPRLGKGVRVRDTSNYSLNVKHIEDGLVAAGILPDDRGDYVRRIILEPPEIDRKAETGTWVEITPVGEAPYASLDRLIAQKQAEALERYSRIITEEWINKGESYGLRAASGQALLQAAELRQQAEGGAQ